ncbi:hypothetical protein [Spirosoma validum]|uniref:Uncharacterized protein n=1 Tax=Spirosoma validum TaxID=2771355 RepID=A0A927B1R8_9BACT|nr:hypothetical protein [Spirosoma validum]MBD2753810.1 hypothetical protein [Spirosoma validum]
MPTLTDALSGDYEFCCKHCQGPLDLIDKQPCYETYQCESCKRQEIIEVIVEGYTEGPEHEDGFPVTSWNGLNVSSPIKAPCKVHRYGEPDQQGYVTCWDCGETIYKNVEQSGYKLLY